MSINARYYLKKLGFWVCLNTRCGSKRDVVQLSDFKSDYMVHLLFLPECRILKNSDQTFLNLYLWKCICMKKEGFHSISFQK